MKFQYKVVAQNFIFLIVAIILGALLLPIGFVYHIGKLVVEFKFKSIFKKLHEFVYHILFVLGYIAKHIALGIDILGNVIAGELLEDCVTSKEDTFYGSSDITISAATGKLELDDNLNKFGKFFTKMLSWGFEPNHSILAYKHFILKKKIEEETKHFDKNSDDMSWYSKG